MQSDEKDDVWDVEIMFGVKKIATNNCNLV
jgi:hypothetical protein